MQAVVLDGPDGVAELDVRDYPEPHPDDDEIRVAVHAVGLNPVDYKLARSGHADWDYPRVLGLDVAGVVDEVGANVHAWNEGDAVYYHGNLRNRGGFAEYAVTDARTVAPLPENRSFVDAAAVPCAGFTAYQALDRRFGVESGESILVHGGSGGVGGFAVQFARLAGLTVYTTCSPENEAYVHRLGADVAIDYHSEDVAERIDDLTDGRGVDYVLDVVGGDTTNEALTLLAFGGELACVVGLPDPDVRRDVDNAASVHDVFLGGAHFAGDPRARADLARMGREVGELLSKRDIESTVAEAVDLDDIPDALARLERGDVTRGKVVATVER